MRLYYFVQKAFLPDFFSGSLFSEGLIIGGQFCVSKWVELDNKNS